MRILVLGDFHGKFLSKFKRIIEKEKIDLIVSTGDFMTYTLRKEFFKNSYVTGENLWDVVGKGRYKRALKKDLRAGENVLKLMQKLPVRIITVTGNIDRTKWEDNTDNSYYKRGRQSWKWFNKDFFTPLIKKYDNVNCVDYNTAKFNEFIFIGYPASSFPGRVKSKNYRKHRRILDRLFKRYKKEKVIFVSHNMPFNTKLDLIENKYAHKLARGEHYGSKLTRRIIETWQPLLCLGGHIHESIGIDKIGKSLIINPGAAHNGKAAIVDIPENKKGKIRVRLLNTEI